MEGHGWSWPACARRRESADAAIDQIGPGQPLRKVDETQEQAGGGSNQTRPRPGRAHRADGEEWAGRISGSYIPRKSVQHRPPWLWVECARKLLHPRGAGT